MYMYYCKPFIHVRVVAVVSYNEEPNKGYMYGREKQKCICRHCKDEVVCDLVGGNNQLKFLRSAHVHVCGRGILSISC